MKHFQLYTLFLTLVLSITSIPVLSQTINWQQAVDVASTDYGHNQPRIVEDANGNPLITWGHNGNLMFSRFEADSFTTPVALNTNGDKVAQASWMSPSIAAKGSVVYIVYKELPEGSVNSHIWIRRSTDNGKTFGDTYQVEDIGNELSRFPTVTVDDNLNPMVAFMKFGPNFTEPHWVVARSTDGGKSFSPDTTAGNHSASNTEACDCCPAVLRTSGETAAMVYRDNNQNLRDIWVGLSKDSGISFPQGFNIDNNNWNVAFCPASAPDAFILGDSLYSCFMSSASGKNRIYLSRSDITNAQWARTVTLPLNNSNFNEQNYPMLDNHYGSSAVVYKETANGESALIIHYIPNISQSSGQFTEVVTEDGVINGDVLLNEQGVHCVWQDLESGTVKYRKGDPSALLNSPSLQLANTEVLYTPNSWIIDKLPDLEHREWRLLNADAQLIESGSLNSNTHLEIMHLGLAQGIYLLELGRLPTIKLIKSN